MSKYSIYSGTFICQSCKLEVHQARFYTKTYDLTWMCNDKHLSRVSLYGRGY
jgi:hypothetical protein